MLLLVFFCIGNGRFDAKLCSCFFGCLASLSVCHGMMFSLIEYLIAYSLVWILLRMFWKSKGKQADNFHLSHVCWHAQRVLIDWSGFCKCPSRVPVISATCRYFVIPLLFSSQVTNTSALLSQTPIAEGCCYICHILILLGADISQAAHFLQQLSNFLLKFIQTIGCTAWLPSNC